MPDLLTWPPGDGILTLADGRTVRGRGLRHPPPDGPVPEFGLYLLGRPPVEMAWPSQWVRWPDFRLPAERVEARSALEAAYERSSRERVEVGCSGGRGRTGTALACLAVLSGVPANEAVAYVRAGYDRRAIETPGQRRYVMRF